MSTAALPPFLDQRLIDTEPPAGYYVDWSCGAWRSLPWPENLDLVPPTLGWAAIEWAEDNLIHHLTGKPWRYTKSQKASWCSGTASTTTVSGFTAAASCGGPRA